MKKKRILFLDSDILSMKAICGILQSHGFDVICTVSTEQAMEIFQANEFCLVIMDVHLDATRGIMILQYIKQKNIPVLVASSLQKRELLEIYYAGADVCLLKPVDVDICAAQALALVRLYDALKMPETYGISLAFGKNFTIDPIYRQVIANGKPLDFTRREFNVLYYLANNRQLVIRYEKIYEEMWGSEPPSIAAVRACINQLRKKLQCIENVSIRNVWGIGYQFIYK